MPNVTASVNKSILQLCKMINKNVEWAEPTPIRAIVSLTNSDVEIQAYGTNYIEYLKIKDTNKVCNNFSIGDRVYYNKSLPTIHNKLQNKNLDSNYEVMASVSANGSGEVRLKKIAGR